MSVSYNSVSTAASSTTFKASKYAPHNYPSNFCSPPARPSSHSRAAACRPMLTRRSGDPNHASLSVRAIFVTLLTPAASLRRPSPHPPEEWADRANGPGPSTTRHDKYVPACSSLTGSKRRRVEPHDSDAESGDAYSILSFSHATSARLPSSPSKWSTSQGRATHSPASTPDVSGARRDSSSQQVRMLPPPTIPKSNQGLLPIGRAHGLSSSCIDGIQIQSSVLDARENTSSRMLGRGAQHGSRMRGEWSRPPTEELFKPRSRLDQSRMDTSTLWQAPTDLEEGWTDADEEDQGGQGGLARRRKRSPSIEFISMSAPAAAERPLPESPSFPKASVARTLRQQRSPPLEAIPAKQPVGGFDSDRSRDAPFHDPERLAKVKRDVAWIARPLTPAIGHEVRGQEFHFQPYSFHPTGPGAHDDGRPHLNHSPPPPGGMPWLDDKRVAQYGNHAYYPPNGFPPPFPPPELGDGGWVRGGPPQPFPHHPPPLPIHQPLLQAVPHVPSWMGPHGFPVPFPPHPQHPPHPPHPSHPPPPPPPPALVQLVQRRPGHDARHPVVHVPPIASRLPQHEKGYDRPIFPPPISPRQSPRQTPQETYDALDESTASPSDLPTSLPQPTSPASAIRCPRAVPSPLPVPQSGQTPTPSDENDSISEPAGPSAPPPPVKAIATTSDSDDLWTPAMSAPRGPHRKRKGKTVNRKPAPTKQRIRSATGRFERSASQSGMDSQSGVTRRSLPRRAARPQRQVLLEGGHGPWKHTGRVLITEPSRRKSGGSENDKTYKPSGTSGSGGFSIKGAASAAAKVRWDRYRREKASREDDPVSERAARKVWEKRAERWSGPVVELPWPSGMGLRSSPPLHDPQPELAPGPSPHTSTEPSAIQPRGAPAVRFVPSLSGDSPSSLPSSAFTHEDNVVATGPITNDGPISSSIRLSRRRISSPTSPVLQRSRELTGDDGLIDHEGATDDSSHMDGRVDITPIDGDHEIGSTFEAPSSLPPRHMTTTRAPQSFVLPQATKAATRQSAPTASRPSSKAATSTVPSELPAVAAALEDTACILMPSSSIARAPAAHESPQPMDPNRIPRVALPLQPVFPTDPSVATTLVASGSPPPPAAAVVPPNISELPINARPLLPKDKPPSTGYDRASHFEVPSLEPGPKSKLARVWKSRRPRPWVMEAKKAAAAAAAALQGSSGSQASSRRPGNVDASCPESAVETPEMVATPPQTSSVVKSSAPLNHDLFKGLTFAFVSDTFLDRFLGPLSKAITLRKGNVYPIKAVLEGDNVKVDYLLFPHPNQAKFGISSKLDRIDTKIADGVRFSWARCALVDDRWIFKAITSGKLPPPLGVDQLSALMAAHTAREAIRPEDERYVDIVHNELKSFIWHCKSRADFHHYFTAKFPRRMPRIEVITERYHQRFEDTCPGFAKAPLTRQELRPSLEPCLEQDGLEIVEVLPSGSQSTPIVIDDRQLAGSDDEMDLEAPQDPMNDWTPTPAPLDAAQADEPHDDSHARLDVDRCPSEDVPLNDRGPSVVDLWTPPPQIRSHDDAPEQPHPPARPPTSPELLNKLHDEAPAGMPSSELQRTPLATSDVPQALQEAPHEAPPALAHADLPTAPGHSPDVPRSGSEESAISREMDLGSPAGTASRRPSSTVTPPPALHDQLPTAGEDPASEQDQPHTRLHKDTGVIAMPEASVQAGDVAPALDTSAAESSSPAEAISPSAFVRAPATVMSPLLDVEPDVSKQTEQHVPMVDLSPSPLRQRSVGLDPDTNTAIGSSASPCSQTEADSLRKPLVTVYGPYGPPIPPPSLPPQRVDVASQSGIPYRHEGPTSGTELQRSRLTNPPRSSIEELPFVRGAPRDHPPSPSIVSESHDRSRSPSPTGDKTRHTLPRSALFAPFVPNFGADDAPSQSSPAPSIQARSPRLIVYYSTEEYGNAVARREQEEMERQEEHERQERADALATACQLLLAREKEKEGEKRKYRSKCMRPCSPRRDPPPKARPPSGVATYPFTIIDVADFGPNQGAQPSGVGQVLGGTVVPPTTSMAATNVGGESIPCRPSSAAGGSANALAQLVESVSEVTLPTGVIQESQQTTTDGLPCLEEPSMVPHGHSTTHETLEPTRVTTGDALVSAKPASQPQRESSMTPPPPMLAGVHLVTDAEMARDARISGRKARRERMRAATIARRAVEAKARGDDVPDWDDYDYSEPESEEE